MKFMKTKREMNLDSSHQRIEIITNYIKEVGHLLEIGRLDHLILTSVGFLSFANDGML